MMAYPLLQVESLTVAFQTKEGLKDAISNVSFELQRGETLAIVGESGSGKSVTSLSILKLLSSSSAITRQGNIWLSPDGINRVNLLHMEPGKVRSVRGKDISMIFQEPMTSLNPVLTCMEQVTEAILAHIPVTKKEARQRAIHLFEKVKLPNSSVIGDRYPHQLSGGQKQRVMIAMAMSCSPALLICDEPTTALDVTVQKAVLETIVDLRSETGMGVIFISHDLGVVSTIADRIAVMYKGSIVELQDRDRLFGQPSHPYTRALLACRPGNHVKGERLPVVADFMKDEENIVTVPIPPKEQSNKNFQPKILLTVKDLTVLYKNGADVTRAVDGVSFEVMEGETLGLAGGSGSGKSTLGRALLRLVPVHSGQIVYRDTSIADLTERDMRKLRREMQIIFQDPYSSLQPRMTIGNAIAEVFEVHTSLKKANIREKVVHLLEKVGLLADHYDRYPHQFSGGQRQRAVIARALALEPSFIVCDESVSALDVSVQAQVLNLLNDLKKEFSFSALFISHDLSVLRFISDRMMVMEQGKIVESGDAETLYTNPKHPYTRQLVESVPGFSGGG